MPVELTAPRYPSGWGMYFGVAVDLAGRGLQDPRLRALGEPEHVDGAVHAGLGRLHGIELVVDRRCRAGEVIDLIDLDVQRQGYVMAKKLEIRVREEVRDLPFSSRYRSCRRR